MSLRLKQFGISLLLRLIELIRLLVRIIVWLVKIILTPFAVILQWALQPAVLFIYGIYLKAMARLKRSAFMRNKVLFIFGNRYFIHVIVVMITVFVASTNLLQAKEITYNENFGQKSALYAIVNPNGEETSDIVETGLITKKSASNSYVPTDVAMIATIPNLDPLAESPRTIGDQLAVVENTSAVVGGSVLETKYGVRSGITEYKVKDGDSIGAIAERFGVTVSTLLWANKLTSSNYIRPGDTLKISPASGVIYTVQSGDTLESIVKKYNGDLDQTIKINDIGNDHQIPVGSDIVIVDGAPPPPPPPPVQSYISNYSNSSSGVTYRTSNAPNYVTAGQFNWPVSCHSGMTTYWGHPNRARDISCPIGTPIYAATDGTVSISFSGQWGHGYGNAIDVHGPNGIMTRYAHMAAFAVSSGQYVTRGQTIGYVGMTGRTSGPHVHFEIWINGTPVDPINYF